MDMQAVIMAGGQGTRLRPLTSNMPKPMLPVVNKPIMEHIVELLASQGFNDLHATLQFLPTSITNYFGDGSSWGVRIQYSLERTPLGTAGSVMNCRRHLDDTFLVISGDALTDIDLNRAVNFHRERGAVATLVLVRVDNPLEFGIVVTDGEGRIERFLEKPNWSQVFSDTINTGIYVLEPEIFSYIPEDSSFDFSQDLFPLLLSKGRPLYGYIADGYWCDVGNFAQYLRAHKDVLEGKTAIRPAGFQIEPGVWMEEDVVVEEGAVLRGPLVLGAHTRIERGTVMREYTVIGSNVVVKEGSFLHRSIIYDNSYIGSSSHLRGCVIGKNCDIKSNVRVEEGVVIGGDCLIGENALINHDVKIYPFKTVEPGAVVNTSIIWESKGMRTLFGNGAITGITNVDVTPEQALRIAMAYGSVLPRGSYVVTSRDASRQARTIKRAVISGLNATGINVIDLEIAPLPVNRFYIRARGAAGGIDVRTSPHDPQSVEIQFFGSEGTDIPESLQRNVEKVYSQANFRRAFSHEIGAISFPHRSIDTYVDALLETMDLEAIRVRGFRMVVDSAFGGASFLLPGILGNLGCESYTINVGVDESQAFLGLEAISGHLEQLSRMVRSSRADFGIVFDGAGERVFLVDDGGRSVGLTEALLLMVKMVTRLNPGSSIAVPVSATSRVEEMAGEHGVKVIRTKESRHALMYASLKEGVVFAGAGGGGYIFPAFLPAYDGMMSMVKLMEMLASLGCSISELLRGLPDVHYFTRDLHTSWGSLGQIMRVMQERSAGLRCDFTDGLKVFVDDRNWVLILPDAEEPLVHIIVDAADDTRGEELAEEYLQLVKEAAEAGS